ncbi:hypothetical protein GCM10010399_43950 [Dactylosporangium fulvum]|uniref:Uncharacterized protein n=1 Tax=Dactylosporangium fulvum TaxID=53359 RepID=A0ABY5W7D6_9ACTN|nr:hypothetical protein [Dactylosporangium fulvum]UWP85938.1 hypothetical protein Dfulv_17465 [Dactylosporangium fulvum]
MPIDPITVQCQKLNDLRLDAEEARAVGDAEHDEYAMWLEHDAAIVEARIKTLEGGDGLAFGAPMYGEAA